MNNNRGSAINNNRGRWITIGIVLFSLGTIFQSIAEMTDILRRHTAGNIHQMNHDERIQEMISRDKYPNKQSMDEE
jgi:hypothetical protein